MSQALYRKYRPQNFKDVVDQNHIKITLQNEILSGQIAHAYLFTGPHGVGKTTLARIMAKTLNCEDRKEKDFEPCEKCDSCVSITAGKNFDLIEIDAATHTQVDKVRENIVENVKFSPHGSKYKVFIIDEVHMLSTAAFNALLKTLEEPPEYVVFILCTTEIYKLPETIISRCQRFDFKKVNVGQVVEKLKKIVQSEKLNIKDEVLNNIALRSGGFMRDAEGLLGQIVTLLSDTKKEIDLKDIEPILPRTDIDSIYNLISSLINRDAKTGIEIINNLINDGIDPERFNLDLVNYLRKMILIKNGLSDKDFSLYSLSAENQKRIIEQTSKIENDFLIKILEKFLSQQVLLKDNEIPQLPLEMAIVELCNKQSTINNQQLTNDKNKVENKNEIKKETTLPPLTKASERSPEASSPRENKNITNSQSNKIIKIEEVKNIWSDFLKQTQSHNHSLPLILQNGFPINIKDNLLEIGFQFDIHFQKMKDEKCLKIAEGILSEILKTNLKIKPIILPAEKISEVKNDFSNSGDSEKNKDEKVDELLKTFGGKVVE